MARKATLGTLDGSVLEENFTAQREADRDLEEALPPPPPPTGAERIDAAFPQTDVAQVLVQVFLTMENQIRTLQDDLSIIADPQFVRRLLLVKSDIVDFMKARLP